MSEVPLYHTRAMRSTSYRFYAKTSMRCHEQQSSCGRPQSGWCWSWPGVEGGHVVLQLRFEHVPG